MISTVKTTQREIRVWEFPDCLERLQIFHSEVVVVNFKKWIISGSVWKCLVEAMIGCSLGKVCYARQGSMSANVTFVAAWLLRLLIETIHSVHNTEIWGFVGIINFECMNQNINCINCWAESKWLLKLLGKWPIRWHTVSYILPSNW